MRNAPFSIAVSALLCLVAALLEPLSGCSTRRGLEPEQVGTFVYVATMGRPGRVIVIDADADSIADSLVIPNGILHLVSDPKNPRFGVMNKGHLRLYHAGVRDPVGEFHIPSARFAFSADPDLIVGSGGPIDGVGDGHIALYSPTDLTLQHVDTFDLSELQVDDSRGLVYGLRYIGTSHVERVEFIAYDYVNRRGHQTWDIRSDSNGGAILFYRYYVHAESQRLYAAGLTASGVVFFCFDLMREEVVFEHEVSSVWGTPRVTPDGREVWYPDPGPAGQRGPETIAVLNAQTGTLLNTIDLTPFRHPFAGAAEPRALRFLPSGKKAYVVSGGNRLGQVLVVDVNSRKVTRTFFDADLYAPFAIAIGPTN